MYRPRHAKHQNIKVLIHVLILLLLIGCLIYPLYEPYQIQIEKTIIESDQLSSDVHQIRIVYLSDIHQSGFPFFTQSRFEKLVRSINALNPDLILLGGDYADSPEHAQTFFEKLSENRLRANYGVYAVLGEHDRETDQSSISLLRSAMIASGTTPLVNDVIRLRIGNSMINIAGLDDVTQGWPNLAGVASTVKGQDFTIFLCHNPSVIPALMQTVNGDGRRNWFQLGLFGHTHGGQIVGMGSLLHLTDDVRNEYVNGWNYENRIHLLTSNGIGTVSLPVRLSRPPQIHLITIRSSR